MANPTREITITRIFDAPRELVFKAWTDPKHLARWWGPNGFTNPVCEVDVRVGGKLHIVMRASDQIAAAIGTKDHPMTGVFREVVPPERLVFETSPVDKDGNHMLDCTTTVTFADAGKGKTKLTVHASAVGLVPMAPRMLEGMEMGWTQSIDRLEALVAELR